MRFPGYLIIIVTGVMTWFYSPASGAGDTFRSPYALKYSPDGQLIAVSDRTAGVVYLLDAGDGRLINEIVLNGQPSGVVWSPDSTLLYVAEYTARTIAEIDVETERVIRHIPGGIWPLDIALTPDGKTLVVADFAMNMIRFIDVVTGQLSDDSISVPRQPFSIALAAQGDIGVVSNLLPHMAATDPNQAAAISVIDINKRENLADIILPAGSTNVRQIIIGYDGLAYVAHTIGRTHLPTTQVEKGWVNTNAVSIIDPHTQQRMGTLLLDYLFEGAANPWGIAISPDGTRLWVTIASAHQLAEIQLPIVASLLRKGVNLERDMSVLRRESAIRRIPLPGNGPRAIAVSPNGSTLAIGTYYSGQILLLDAMTLETKVEISLGDKPEMTPVRYGELIFHDARHVKQTWLACVTCHSEARVDGQNWDLLNDGLGNPKNSRSLLWSYKTPPVMSRGVRASMEVASAAGFRHIAFQQVAEPDLEATRAYLRSLEPDPSPYLTSEGKLTAEAEIGRTVFNRESVGCANCHAPPLYTNLKMFDVGTRSRLDQADHFDTPTLVEIWRTGPYLHDGSAATLREVLIDRNPRDKHGKTSHLSDTELNTLIAYLLSL